MRKILLLAAFVWIAAIDGLAQRPVTIDKAAQAKIDETVATYAAAWNEPDIAERRRMLEKAWAASGTYTDPTVHLEGREPLAQHISGFQKGLPGVRIMPTSRTDLHHGMLRFTWRIVKADGTALSDGMDYGEVDSEGRLRKIVGFFGPFAPLERIDR